MVKDASGGKRAKISQAQQYMILAVFGAAVFLGAAIAVVISSINKISFSANVIVAQDQSIVEFSDTIKNIGICQKPSGKVYTDDELKKCNPNNISAGSVSGTLRSDIIERIASNEALLSVPNENNDSCINPETKKNYTYAELEENYNSAEGEEALAKASSLIKACSALRIIPDAIPAYKNEEALLASVDKIFRDAGSLPESLSPSDESSLVAFGTRLSAIPVRLSFNSKTGDINAFFNSTERSIRNINIEQATIEWISNESISLQARALAYFMEPSTLTITDKIIQPSGGKK